MLVPKLRFKREDGTDYPEWEEKTLGDITVQINKKTTNKLLPVYSVNNQKGFIPQVEQFGDREIASKDKTNYRKVSFNQFAYNPSRINVGSIAYLQENICVIVSPLYVVFECLPMANPAFIDGFVRTSLFDVQRKMNTAGSVRDSLSYDGFSTIVINLPCLEEQQKIANFLSTVDEVIAQSRAEIQNLEQQKKAAMQKIFSQEVRFKHEDRTEYPEWEDKTIGAYCDILDNMRKPITKRDRKAGVYPYYGSTNIQDYIDGYIFDEPLVLLGEDAAPFMDSKEKPIAQLATGKYWVNNHAHCLRPHGNVAFFYYSVVHKDIREYINNPNRAKLNQEDMIRIVVSIPCLEEQQKIADFLSAYDEAISYAKQELDKWKEFKKGLLQQMFV